MKTKSRKGKLGVSGLLALAVGSVLVALAKGDTIRTDVTEPAPARVLVVTTHDQRQLELPPGDN
jgi:hypothetical protein